MSYGQNGVNGYGSSRGGPPTRYDEEYRDPRAGGGVSGPPAGGGRARRAGGYGGFFEEEPKAPESSSLRSEPPPVIRPPSNRSESSPGMRLGGQNRYGSTSSDPYGTPPLPVHSPRRTRDQPSENSHGGSRNRLRHGATPSESRMYGEGPAGRQIEGVVDHINEKWGILTTSDCVPAQVALQLMDTSSLGRGNDYDDFLKTGNAMQKSLKAVVNEHHQGFNSSIGTFHKIQDSIQISQDRVRTLKSSLIEAKANLTMARPELGGLLRSSQNYDEMLSILAQIEKIQALPEQLDSRISEKRFLAAVDVLQGALRLIRNSALEKIGGLADLRVYLSNQETSLTDILLEELHDHLYLKSPYCQSRWKAYSPSTGDVLDPNQSVSNMSMGIRPLYRFLTGLNATVPMADDSTRNPEEDSFQYIYMIIEALNKMGRLDVAVDRMEQRLPIELFAVVEKTNQEVDQRHPVHLRTTQARDWTRQNMKATKSDSTEAVLNDLLHTLYSKFEAIAEGHRAVHEVVSGIVQREGLKTADGLLKGFKELWKLYQSEMRSLLHDYLATDGNPLYNSRDAAGGSLNIFQRNQRDKLKRVFKLGDLDKKSAQLAAEQEELDKILQKSVPGLVSKSYRRPDSTFGAQRAITYDSPAAGHKLLVEPSVFNISVLLPPSLIFLQRLKDTVPPDSDIAVSTLTSFLDDFLVNVFNPQLDETVTELCSQSFMQMDAFQEDPNWSEHAKMPIFRGTSLFYALIKEFCKMLDNIPQDQMFTTLILSQLNTYYDRCMTWSETLVSRSHAEGGSQLKPAAAILKEDGEMSTVIRDIWATDDSARAQAMQKEVDLMISRTNELPIGPFDIVCDRRAGTSLCLLYSSMQWLASQLRELRFVVKKKENEDAKQARKANRWTMLSAATMRDGDQPIILPLTEDTVAPFDKTLTAYRELATRSLFILHVDVRFNIIHMLARVYESHYLFDQPVNEPHLSILQLNNDLMGFDDTITSHLPEREYKFITSGLGLLLDTFLVTNSSKIGSMNTNGCDRMLLNILVLQQNLKSVEKDVMLRRSAQFFDYFKQGPKFIVQRAKDTGGQNLGFSLEEVKVLVQLCYSEAIQSPQREFAAQAKRAMGDNMLQLTEYMWST